MPTKNESLWLASGIAGENQARTLNLPLEFTRVLVGDANGNYPLMDSTITELVNYRQDGELLSHEIDINDVNQRIVEMSIAPSLDFDAVELLLYAKYGDTEFAHTYFRLATPFSVRTIENGGSQARLKYTIRVSEFTDVNVFVTPDLAYVTHEQLIEKQLQISSSLTGVDNKIITIEQNLQQQIADLKTSVTKQFTGVEGAFQSDFEVGGSPDFYYPVAISVHSEADPESNPRTPLFYDIFRNYEEKAPEALNTGTQHYLGLSLKFWCTDGGWDAGVNTIKVLMHQWRYNKGVAKMQLFNNQESRLFVWLRGGGVLYHIRSPIDLSGRVTTYIEDNAVATPAYESQPERYPDITVNPIAVGDEDENLVKTGVYEGWAI